jgi:3-hydroxyacyl-CoA dehydrogenase/enoyl-CoA hydratase/3-hydroxybutyryl-CoA epimerase
MSINYEKDNQNIVTLTLDTPGKTVNVINLAFIGDLQQALDQFMADTPTVGIILTSAKASFIAGGDINMIFQLSDPKTTFEFVEHFKTQIRRLETQGKPVVAALNGTAMGGGLEMALACHYRVAIDDPRVKFGLPEVNLGLLPGGGGLTRLTRLLGLQAAFPYLMEGTPLSPQEAQKAGIVHELAADRAELLQKARAWILNNPQAAQPWDQKGYKMPGGDPSRPQVAQMISVAPAMLLDKTFGNYPAPQAILSAMVEGAMTDFDTASRIESRAFTFLATGKTAKNIMLSTWYQLNEINNGRSRPTGIEPQSTKKVGILGAGMMGHGIAYVSASVGIEVVLKDVSQAAAETGKARVEKILDGRLRQGKLSEQEKQTILNRILPTANAEDLRDCDLVVEAVFENRELKGRVTREAEAQISADTIFCSNTSTLPITGLAEMSARPENFVGLHFFSPVHKMKLVEIIRGRQTAPHTLAKAFDFVMKIRKTPIVVNDSRGFYTSRVFTTFVHEGMALLAEGQSPRAIEMAALMAGMPVGPLAVADEVNLGLALHIREQTRQDLLALGQEWVGLPSDGILDLMVNREKRPGKAQGAGFYEYPADGKKYLWPRLREIFPARAQKLFQNEMSERMLFIQALETARCYAEGVIESAGDANIGSIFGWGFAPFKGGTLQFINDYGLPAFVRRSRELAGLLGERFDPPALLVEMAEQNRTF